MITCANGDDLLSFLIGHGIFGWLWYDGIGWLLWNNHIWGRCLLYCWYAGSSFLIGQLFFTCHVWGGCTWYDWIGFLLYIDQYISFTLLILLELQVTMKKQELTQTPSDWQGNSWTGQWLHGLFRNKKQWWSWDVCHWSFVLKPYNRLAYLSTGEPPGYRKEPRHLCLSSKNMRREMSYFTTCPSRNTSINSTTPMTPINAKQFHILSEDLPMPLTQ